MTWCRPDLRTISDDYSAVSCWTLHDSRSFERSNRGLKASPSQSNLKTFVLTADFKYAYHRGFEIPLNNCLVFKFSIIIWVVESNRRIKKLSSILQQMVLLATKDREVGGAHWIVIEVVPSRSVKYNGRAWRNCALCHRMMRSNEH